LREAIEKGRLIDPKAPQPAGDQVEGLGVVALGDELCAVMQEAAFLEAEGVDGTKTRRVDGRRRETELLLDSIGEGRVAGAVFSPQCGCDGGDVLEMVLVANGRHDGQRVGRVARQIGPELVDEQKANHLMPG